MISIIEWQTYKTATTSHLKALGEQASQFGGRIDRIANRLELHEAVRTADTRNIAANRNAIDGFAKRYISNSSFDMLATDVRQNTGSIENHHARLNAIENGQSTESIVKGMHDLSNCTAGLRQGIDGLDENHGKRLDFLDGSVNSHNTRLNDLENSVQSNKTTALLKQQVELLTGNFNEDHTRIEELTHAHNLVDQVIGVHTAKFKEINGREKGWVASSDRVYKRVLDLETSHTVLDQAHGIHSAQIKKIQGNAGGLKDRVNAVEAGLSNHAYLIENLSVDKRDYVKLKEALETFKRDALLGIDVDTEHNERLTKQAREIFNLKSEVLGTNVVVRIKALEEHNKRILETLERLSIDMGATESDHGKYQDLVDAAQRTVKRIEQELPLPKVGATHIYLRDALTKVGVKR